MVYVLILRMISATVLTSFLVLSQNRANESWEIIKRLHSDPNDPDATLALQEFAKWLNKSQWMMLRGREEVATNNCGLSPSSVSVCLLAFLPSLPCRLLEVMSSIVSIIQLVY